MDGERERRVAAMGGVLLVRAEMAAAAADTKNLASPDGIRRCGRGTAVPPWESFHRTTATVGIGCGRRTGAGRRGGWRRDVDNGRVSFYIIKI